MIALIINKVFQAPHSTTELDKELTNKAMKNLENMAKETGSETLHNLRDALQRLCAYADSISLNTTPERDSPRLNLWDGEARASFLESPEYQCLENEILMPEIDIDWAFLTGESI